MKNDDKFLFISNGYGEDTIATSIINELVNLTDRDRIVGFPLVGEGQAYSNIGIPVVAPVRNMPSGGLIPGGWVKNLWMDFSSGLARLTLMQVSRLGELKKDLRAVVAVGDTYPVILGGLFTGKPILFVGTAKSDYFYPYSPIEREIFKRYCKIVFPRDEITAKSLKNNKINAKWVGNAMMDSLNFTGERFGIPQDKTVITLLPGSRSFAYDDLPVILKAAERIKQELDDPPAFLAPLANSIEVPTLGKSAQKAGFSLIDNHNDEGVVGKLTRHNMEVLLLRKRFGDSINMADLVIGQAGTGNEQAVGLGKPVVAFDSSGNEKLGWYRLRQKGLLGGSLSITPRDPENIATETLDILRNREKYEEMAGIGRERMGPPGGAKKMAEHIANFAG
ncbi:MAG: lipid-A-disaccharide synthase-related protein [Candidatus Eremiobacteraeota bacterium]|nr:lipid-A-disaccharide synthase-related protein [Candidatus Eremiobacteraeota bacterium]